MPKKHEGLNVFACIAIDVTAVAFPHNGVTFGVTPEHCRDIVQDKLRQCSELFHNDFEPRPRLLGYWLQIHIPSLVMAPTTWTTRFSSLHIGYEQSSRRARQARRHFYDIFERVSEERDTRAVSPRRLRLRQGLTIPKGTQFGMNGEVVAALLEGRGAVDIPQDACVGAMMIGESEHLFTGLDLGLLPREAIELWRQSMSADPPRAEFDLLCAMYLARFPYEEDEPEPTR